jgi:ABC-2 type transport system permease protein
LEAEIGETYGIRSFPFGVSDRNSQAVVNAYFHLLVKYGDKYEVLSFQDLIEVQADDRDLKVVLRNFEYDMTRTIKKVSQDFQSLDVVLASLPGEAKITAYITPATLPEEFQSSAEAMRTVGEEFAKKGRGKVIFTEVDPSATPGMDQRLFDEFGLRPLAADLLGTETFYLHLLVEAGGSADRILPRGELTEADLRKALEAAIKRATPGQLKTLAVLTEIPEAPPPNPQIPPQFQPPPPQPDFRQVQALLEEFYQVRPESLEEGFVPEDVDILLVAKPGALSEKQQYAVDQFLMRGGAVIALAGSYAIDLSQQGLQAKTQDRSLHQLLEHYGVKVVEGLLMDPQNAQFPMPRIERRGGFQLQRVELVPYPLLPDIRQDGFLAGHPALAGVNGVTLPWASPLELVEDKLAKVERFELLKSSAASWVDTTGNIQPDLATYPDFGFPVGAERASRLGAVALQGKFSSYFAGKRNPVYGNESADASGRTLAESVVDGRLVVVGSSELISDLLIQMASQPTGAVHRGNLQLVQNLMDWTVEDTDLLSIRAGAAFTRTLNPLSDDMKFTWEMLIYAACLAPLVLTALAQLGRGRRATPLPLPKEVA